MREESSGGRAAGTASKTKLRKVSKGMIALIAVIVILAAAAGGTIAYLTTGTGTAENAFTFATVTGEIDETVDENYKKSIKAVNTSEVPVYARINLVSYKTDSEGNQAAGEASIDMDGAQLNPDWVLNEADGYYYCTEPIAAGESSDLLAGDEVHPGIKLESYEDGTVQAIDVLAQFIQADGTIDRGEGEIKAVVDAWGVDPETLKE